MGSQLFPFSKAYTISAFRVKVACPYVLYRAVLSFYAKALAVATQSQ